MIKITITGSGDLAKELRTKTHKMMADLQNGLMQQSPVDIGTFEGAWQLDPNTLSLENPMEYAEALANGHSSQAPQGWIEAEIDRVTKL